ncbi:hypothetical protein DINM_005329 [Dirofilaria immitis]|nr:hypothetical protein [Dirofilaria immitis]
MLTRKREHFSVIMPIAIRQSNTRFVDALSQINATVLRHHFLCLPSLAHLSSKTVNLYQSMKLNSTSTKNYEKQLLKSDVETTVENERIRNLSSIITKPVTVNPMVVYSTKGIKSTNDENKHYDGVQKNEVNAQFIDIVIRSLLPNVDLKRIIDPEELATANYSKESI